MSMFYIDDVHQFTAMHSLDEIHGDVFNVYHNLCVLINLSVVISFLHLVFVF